MSQQTFNIPRQKLFFFGHINVDSRSSKMKFGDHLFQAFMKLLRHIDPELRKVLRGHLRSFIVIIIFYILRKILVIQEYK
jgi:hypothetical protein